jgi:tetratricopeptide (TPR) repeat protein
MKIRHWLLLTSCLAFAACAGTGSSFLAGRQALLRGEPDNAANYFNAIAQTDPSYVVTSAPPRKSIWTYLGRAYYNAGRYAEAKVALDKALTYVKDDDVARLYRGLTVLRGDTAAPPANAMTLQEVSYALREGVAPRRVGTISRERGIAFDLNAETENQLRTAGADSTLLDELKQFRAERAKQGKASDKQRMEGAKEIAAALTGLRDWLDYTIAHTPQGRYWDPSGEIRTEISRALRSAQASQPNWEIILSNAELVGYNLEEESDRARRDEAEEGRRMRP